MSAPYALLRRRWVVSEARRERVRCQNCGNYYAQLRAGGPYPHNCRSKDDHVGYFFEHRTRGDYAQARRERGFAKQWREENDSGLNRRSLPDQLLANQPDFELPLSRRERRLVATVVQWLGSSVGFCFLEQALKRGGYRIEKKVS